MFALVGALKEEVADLHRHMVLEQAFTWQRCRLYKGKYEKKDVLLLQTGTGKESAEIAARFILERYPVTTLISLGFAGALTQELKVGDIIICSTLHCANGLAQPDSNSGETYSSDVSLVSMLSQVMEGTGLRFSCGGSVTVTRPVFRLELRRTLGQAFRADIVDMESYWIARIAAERQVPFLAVRAISDIMQDSRLPFDQILTLTGEWQWPRAIPYFILHPQHLTRLFALYRDAREARKNLTAVVNRLVVNL